MYSQFLRCLYIFPEKKHSVKDRETSQTIRRNSPPAGKYFNTFSTPDSQRQWVLHHDSQRQWVLHPDSQRQWFLCLDSMSVFFCSLFSIYQNLSTASQVTGYWNTSDLPHKVRNDQSRYSTYTVFPLLIYLFFYTKSEMIILDNLCVFFSIAHCSMYKISVSLLVYTQ